METLKYVPLSCYLSLKSTHSLSLHEANNIVMSCFALEIRNADVFVAQFSQQDLFDWQPSDRRA